MSFNPSNPNGQATSANSQPVVLSSDQPTFPVDANGTKVTAAALPTGGVGFLGWLSAIWYQLTQVITVAGTTNRVFVTLTRPANVTAYAALAAINQTSAIIFTLTNALRANGVSGYISFAQMFTDQTTNVARYRVHVYNVNNPAIVADGAQFTFNYADLAGYQGSIDFSAMLTEGTGSTSAKTPPLAGNLLVVQAAVADRNLYVLFETLDAIAVPASAQNYRAHFAVESN